MEGYLDRCTVTEEELNIDTYCYCNDEDDLFCVIVDVIDDGRKYKILDFNENRERIVVKSSLQRIYDTQDIIMAKSQHDEYINKQHTPNNEEKDLKPIPFTDPDNKWVEFWVKKKDEGNNPYEIVVWSVIIFVFIIAGIVLGLLYSMLIMLFLCVLGLLLIPFCLNVTREYKTEKMFVFDSCDKTISYKTRYNIFNGYLTSKLYGTFEEFTLVKEEIVEPRHSEDCRIFYIVWKFGDDEIKYDADDHEDIGRELIDEIKLFWRDHGDQLRK